MKKGSILRLFSATLAICALLSGSALPFSSHATEAEAAPETVRQPDTFTINAFWPPNPNTMDLDEQFRLMADAGITELLGAGNGCDTPEIQAQFLEMAQKYGINVVVSGGNLGNPSLSEEEVIAFVSQYADNPWVSGFSVVDEPENPNVHINTYRAIRQAAPHLNGHVNFAPFYIPSSTDTTAYRRVINDWASLTNAVCDNPTYLMYDFYVFRENESGFDYHAFFANMELVRREGLRNETPTAVYLQSVTIPGNLRTPNANEIRYQLYAAMAYGFKKFSYFTWITPTGQAEYFENGILSSEGVPNEHYAYVSEVNHEALALGTTLVHCDAIDVYMTMTEYNYYNCTELLPEDYPISVVEGGNADMILTRFVHKETGRNYLMLVNNDMTAPHSLSFTVDEEITGLEKISKTDGSLAPYAADNGVYTVTLSAGDGILLALPEDYVCPVDMERANASIADRNIAPEAKVMASSSSGQEKFMPPEEGQEGWFVYNLTDGNVKPSRQKDYYIGWQSEDDANPVLTFDFGEPIALDTVKIYPSGAMENRKYGVYMPRDFTLSVSDDGKAWTTVTAVTDFTYTAGAGGDPLTVALEGAVGRFLRLEVTEANLTADGQALTQIGEIEIFGSPAASKAGLADLVKEYVRFGGDTAAELYVTALAAAEDASSRQGYVDLLVKKMSPVVEELEATYQPPVETETTDSVPTETEAVTQILAPADTLESTETQAPADTTAQVPENTTEAGDDATREGGCSSVVGFGAISVLTASAAAVALKKKPRE